MTLKAVTHYCG